MTCASAIVITAIDLGSYRWFAKGQLYETNINGRTRAYAVHTRGDLIAILASYEDALLVAELEGRRLGMMVIDRLIETLPDHERLDLVRPSPHGGL